MYVRKEVRNNRAEEIFEETIAENFLKQMKNN
jgi:hypothetical protein